MLISNGTVVTLGSNPQMIHDGAVHIRDNRIDDVGLRGELIKRYPDDTRFDAGGGLIMPANICAHTHFYGAFARGLSIPGDAPATFTDILRKLWWRLDRCLALEDVKYSALVCLVDAIRHGTTTLFDHHASPHAIAGSLDVIRDAVRAAGLRACLCYEVTDRNGKDGAEAGIRENLRFIRETEMHPSEDIAATFGLHASLTLSDETLSRCAADADKDGIGFHIHAAEGAADQEDSLKKSGKRVIHRLNDLGILGRKTILAHCIHLDAWEMETIRDTGAWVTHQPRSNMNNAVGVAPVETMLRGGIPVAMGNDGFSNNMWAEWKAAYLVHKLQERDPRKGDGYNVLAMGVTHNARLARAFWPRAALGEISPNAYADIIIVDYKPFTELTPGNFPWHVLFGFEADMISSVMSQGRWVMKHRKILTLDEEEIAGKAMERSKSVWKRFNELEIV